MRIMKPARIPNYLVKLNAMVARGEIPDISAVQCDIAHDSWCASAKGGCCDCDPNITFTSLASRN